MTKWSSWRVSGWMTSIELSDKYTTRSRDDLSDKPSGKYKAKQ